MSKPVVAIVGRPNVGKSTLFNVLAGERISIVKDTPGVTRDRIYADVTWLDYHFTMIDTGGIEPDSKDIILSQMREQAEIAIATADVIIFLTDVRQGLQDSDSKVADMLRRSGKPVVLVVNKVDSFEKFMPDVYEFYNLGIGDPYPISASSMLGLGDMLDEVVKNNSMRVATGVLNEIVAEAVAMQQPPSDKGKRLKIYYTTQVAVKPPTFVIFVNDKELMHFSYTRYLENRIRDTFGFRGTALKFIIRERKEEQ